MNTYKIFYTFNDDLKRIFIEIEADDRKEAIDWLKNTGSRIGLEYKIISCRIKK